VGYTRVSTGRQRDSGYSLEQQAEAIRAFAQREGLRLVQIFSDPGRSGGSLANRPGLHACLRLVSQGGFGAVVLHTEDRLSRRVHQARQVSSFIFRHQAAIIILNPEQVDTGPAPSMQGAGIDLRGLLQILAEDELGRTCSRVLPGVTRAAMMGRRGGHLPPGYRRLSPDSIDLDPERAPAIRACFGQVAAGASLYRVLATLSASGVTRPDGKAYTREQVEHLLSNRWYLGECSWQVPQAMRAREGNIILHHSHHPALVDPLLFATVQERLVERRRPRSAVADLELDADTDPVVAHPDGGPGAGAQVGVAAAPPAPASAPPVTPPAVAAAPAASPHSRSGQRAPTPSLETLVAGRQGRQPRFGIVPPQVAICGVCGSRMHCSAVTVGPPGHRYQKPYYTCLARHRYGYQACATKPIPAETVDTAIERALVRQIAAGRLTALGKPVLPPDVTAVQRDLDRAEQRLERFLAARAQLGSEGAHLEGAIAAATQAVTLLRADRDRHAQTMRRANDPLSRVLEDWSGTWPSLTVPERREVVLQVVAQVRLADKQVVGIEWAQVPGGSDAPDVGQGVLASVSGAEPGDGQGPGRESGRGPGHEPGHEEEPS
jgi:DNA invertase Pin-like site-specific DNA recombinase